MEYLDAITSYLEKYSSKGEPKSITDIAETLTIDDQDVGYVIHELLKKKVAFSTVHNGEVKYFVIKAE